ncbi:MAG: hypothetical protein NUV51_12595 [Sulfuricaulis sp.]|nr:hypothetical protein [Sulfuricaulis sp.]
MMRRTKPQIRVDNMNRLIEQRFGGVQARFANAIGVTPSQVSQWRSGTREMTKESAERIEDRLQLPDGYLDRMAGATRSNISHATNPTHRVPLLPFQRAAEIRVVIEQQQVDAPEWIDARYASKKSVAFRVENESMVSSSGLSFPPGTVIIVEPLRGPQAGDYVVALDPQTGHPTFKRLASDAGRWFLRPLNPTYPTTEIPDTSCVLGVVSEWQVGGKL